MTTYDTWKSTEPDYGDEPPEEGEELMIGAGQFVTEGTTDKVGVTLAVQDPTEANPLVLVRWIRDLKAEWVRSEYLYLADTP